LSQSFDSPLVQQCSNRSKAHNVQKNTGVFSSINQIAAVTAKYDPKAKPSAIDLNVAVQVLCIGLRDANQMCPVSSHARAWH
jgi:hypothetical protein